MTNKWYGWRPDRPDQRDQIFDVPRFALPLPTTVDLRSSCPPVMNQGSLGSCTANGGTGIVRAERMKRRLPDVKLARLQVYYDTRKLEGTINSDSGAEIRTVMKAMVKWGCAPEIDWPYVIKNFKKRPPAKAYRNALANQALVYERVPQDEGSIRATIAGGFPIVFGYSVYESFETEAVEKTGIVPMPAKTEKDVGGHCVYAVGYGIKGTDLVTCRNSWGTKWGDKGDFHMPMAYLCDDNLSADFWIVRKVG